MNNPFALFDLPIEFQLDQNRLSERYLALQKALHPDNFANSSAQEQRLAMQKSAEVNDALQILKDPILRADCIIALNTGEQQNTEEKSTQDMAFLMQQMQWREQLEEIENTQDIDGLMTFSAEIEQSNKEKISEISTALSMKDWQQAKLINDRLRFIKKLMTEIERIEDKLADF
ncbi:MULTISPECIES: Fe-S protein assembly co-chaperone HscB [Basfia]|uniref:Co-chaperone protein HscB homolog n=1 Tax=Mannheimia succiniciproducens (strain KCTC 0769BP / MBEL55E) TaxID=221988 RepID=HSCB_MANSM|nr:MULTISPECIES: Fe-S protein assembly co-chaperone HscB [Basfia]Q65RT1.1 RecName: Full=Co-chaperone protein HscB homolog [[Mannheimia] succiniciproducens MBEL55E]AAU38329.1 DjlA protein [[Mannheimia] succiniciproducens MBEL55E]SEQ37970.1 Co-chaperone protein HscB [Basfia succiniciproducens]